MIARWLAFTVAVLVGVPGTAFATNWVDAVSSGSKAQAQAQTLPAPPSGGVAVCTSASAKTIKVSWNSVTHTSTYSVYESSTSASSGYSLAASGITATSWTSGNLSTGTYWFEVAAVVGTNWQSPNSTATASHVIAGDTCT